LPAIWLIFLVSAMGLEPMTYWLKVVAPSRT
jgi:hypothetical protein